MKEEILHKTVFIRDLSSWPDICSCRLFLLEKATDATLLAKMFTDLFSSKKKVLSTTRGHFLANGMRSFLPEPYKDSLRVPSWEQCYCAFFGHISIIPPQAISELRFSVWLFFIVCTYLYIHTHLSSYRAWNPREIQDLFCLR